MSERRAAAAGASLTQGGVGRALRVRLSAALWLTTLAVGTLPLTGYRSFRADHQTQVPMLLRRLDPSLLADDWYFSGEAQFAVRSFYLGFQQLLHSVLPSVELLFFLQYLMVTLACVAALRALAIRLERDAVYLVLLVLCVYGMRRFGSFAGVDVVEPITLPRMFANLACVWAVPLLLGGRALVAGFVLGALGLFQAAPTLQLLPLLVVWLVWMRGARRGLRTGAVLAAGFALGYWPQLAVLQRLVESNRALPIEELAHWIAYVRHPRLMLPDAFRLPGYLELGSLGLFVAALARSGRLSEPGRQLLRLAVVIAVFLAGALFFLSVFPFPALVIAQPMRMAAILRIPLYALLALHVHTLLRSGERHALWRGLLFVFAAWNCEARWVPMAAWLVFESAVLLCQGTPAVALHAARAAAVGDALVWLPYGRARWIALLLAGAFFARARDPVASLRSAAAALARSPLARAAAPVGALGLLVLVTAFPFRAWQTRDPADWSPIERRHASLARKIQVHPFPDAALERAAWWARQHTPPGTAFVIPPQLGNESFHIWSQRTAVFNMKLFPFAQAEWPDWIARYYAHGGVLDPAADPERAQRLRRSRGGTLVGTLYARLPAATLAALARRYGAEYVLSYDAALGGAAEFETAAGPFFSSRDILRRKTEAPGLLVFRLREAPLPAAAGAGATAGDSAP